MKKILIVVICFLVVAASSIQVYAATVLDTDMVSLIKDIIDGADSVAEIESRIPEYTIELDTYVDSELEKAQMLLDDYQNDKINDADEEIQTYLASIKSEVSAEVSQEVQTEKAKIDQDLEKEVVKVKEGLKIHLMDALKNKNK